jgi:hypothetical protein
MISFFINYNVRRFENGQGSNHGGREREVRETVVSLRLPAAREAEDEHRRDDVVFHFRRRVAGDLVCLSGGTRSAWAINH